MTGSASDDEPIFHGRRPWQLIAVWLGGAALAAAIYLFGVWQPVYADIIEPFYFMIATVLLAITWKWLRDRQPRSERRTRNRRQVDRRDRR